MAILRERLSNLPYQDLESSKTIFLPILSRGPAGSPTSVARPVSPRATASVPTLPPAAVVPRSRLSGGLWFELGHAAAQGGARSQNELRRASTRLSFRHTRPHPPCRTRSLILKDGGPCSLVPRASCGCAPRSPRILRAACNPPRGGSSSRRAWA